jgi:hypothetical protein
MAKFKVIDAEINTIPATAHANAGNEYLQVTLKNADNFWSENERKQNFFSAGIVNAFKKYISQEKGGDAEEDKPLPEEMSIMHGTFEVVTYDKPFYRRYMSDLVDGAGNMHHKGDYIDDLNGGHRLYNALEVFCKQYYDSDACKYVYERGNSKEILAQGLFNSSCEFASTAVAKEEDTIAEETAKNIAPQQQPQQQQQRQPQNGYQRR